MVIADSFKLCVKSVSERISPVIALMVSVFFFFSFHFGCCLLTGEKVFTSVNRLDALFPKEQIALTAFQQTVVCTGTTQKPIIK